MTVQDAIHKMTFIRNGYQKLLDEGCDEGRVVGTNIEGYWKSDTPLHLVYQKHVDACDLAITALEQMAEREERK